MPTLPGSVLYLASQVPVVLVPTSPPSQSACTDTTTTAGTAPPVMNGSTTDFPEQYNQMLAQFVSGFAYGGGYGVMDGLALSTASGLALPVAAGTAACMGQVAWPGGTVVVPDSTPLGFVWLLQNGTLLANAVLTPPTANCVYIGNFTTSGGNITVVDYTGVPFNIGFGLIRVTNDRSAPSDTPNAGTTSFTITQAGLYVWTGANYNLFASVGGSYGFTASLTSTIALSVLDNNIAFNLTASGGNQIVLLPDPATLPQNWKCQVNNVGGSNSVIIKDHTNTITLCNIAFGNSINPSVYNNAGTIEFPTGPWTASSSNSAPIYGPIG